MPRRKKELEDTVETTTETVEFTKEEATEEPKAELMMAVEEKKPELTEAEQAILTEQKLLELYEKSPQGSMLLGYVMVETGCHNIEKLTQAWDRLHSKGKVGYSKFYKP